jgi:glycosyltransferase involved in cell wall biosynthesis
MKLSFVILSLNEERYLRLCLPSIARYDHAGLEVETIVVDSGSTDRSREIAREHGARVVECPRGIPLARNVGARHATGELIAYLDADGELEAGWFETVIRAFATSHRKILGAPPRLPPDATWIARAYAMHDIPTDLIPGEESDRDWLITCHCMVLGREVFDEVGGFREDLLVDEDTHFVRAAVARGIPTACDPGLAYIHHGEPRTVGEFFRRTVWGATYGKWFDLVRRRERGQLLRLQYLFGMVVAGELAALGLSLAAPVGGWQLGVPLSLAALTATFGLPALRTALRHGAPAMLGELVAMYSVYGVANAAALVGMGKDKHQRWR